VAQASGAMTVRVGIAMLKIIANNPIKSRTIFSTSNIANHE
jgi:hypothetical protein